MSATPETAQKNPPITAGGTGGNLSFINSITGKQNMANKPPIVNDFLVNCKEILLQNGIVEDYIVTTSNIVRCGTTDKPTGKDAAYICHLDGATLWWQNWCTGETGVYTAKHQESMSREERAELKKRIEAAKQVIEAERQTRYDAATTTAQRIFTTAIPATSDHPYLVTKKVLAYGLKLALDKRLIVPLYNDKGKVQSVQFIAADGTKRFLAGGKTASGFFSIPTQDGSKDGILLIAEGYSTAASLHLATGHACLVAFNAGNLEAVAKMARSLYPEREIILCADNDLDGVGIPKATTAAVAIGAKLAVPPAHEGKKTDFNDLHLWRNLQAVKACVDAAESPQGDTTENDPIPLRRPPQEAQAYPIEALGGYADAVKAIAQAIQAPVAMVACSVLSALSLCTQSIANVQTYDGRTIPLSLFFLSIADSGDRKSAIDKITLDPVKKYEREQDKIYQQAYNKYLQAKKSYELALRKHKKGDTEPQEPIAPMNPTLTVSNANAEGIYRQLKEGRPSIGIFSDEAGTLFGGTAFAKENILKSIAFFACLWDGTPLDKLRSGEGHSRLYDRRASAHLMLQPAIAENILADELLQGQGFLPRFLVAWPNSLKGTRSYKHCNVCADDSVIALYDVCNKLLEMPLRIDQELGGMVLDALHISPEAHKEWVDYHDLIEEQLAPNEELRIISAHASKSGEQALRIAGVLELADNPASRTISVESMHSGIAIAQWHLSEVLRLRQDGMTSPEILKAEQLLKWAKDKGHSVLSVRLIMRFGPNNLREGKAIYAVLATLVDHKQICPVDGGCIFEGKSVAKAWRVQS